MKYTQLYDGDWIYPLHRGFRLRCCDCSLIHVLDFKVERGWVKMRVKRNDRATAQARRHDNKRTVRRVA